MNNPKKVLLREQFGLLRPGVYEICDSVTFAGIEIYEVGWTRLLLVVNHTDWEFAVKKGIVVDPPIDTELNLSQYTITVGPHGLTMTVPTELGVPMVIEQKRVA